MSTDLVRAGSREVQDNTASSAETILLDHSHNAGGAQRSQAFRGAAGTVLAALRFDAAASRTARERSHWAVQQSPAGKQGLPRDADGSTAAQVLMRVQMVASRFTAE